MKPYLNCLEMRDFSWYVIPKAGSTSLIEHFGVRPIEGSDKPSYVALRDPIERFAAAVSQSRLPIMKAFQKDTPTEEIVEAVLSGEYEDVHFRPACLMYPKTATRVRLGGDAMKALLGEIPVRHRLPKTEIPRHFHQDILNYSLGDQRLFEEAA